MHPTEFLTKLHNISKEDLINIKGIGDVLADNIIEFCESNEFSVIRNKFETLEAQNLGLDILVKDKNTIVTGELSGETICITGTFDIPRPQIRTKLEGKGAKVVDTVSKTTTILLAGESAGSKLDKAQKLGIRIIENLDELVV
jgi:DNA ligase (NAD+)